MRKLQKLVAKLYRQTHRNVCVIRTLSTAVCPNSYLVYDLDTYYEDSNGFFRASVIGRFKTVASCEAFLVSLFR